MVGMASPFAGILRYQGGDNGYATLFRYFNDAAAFLFKHGMQLAFQHGTWKNNSVTFIFHSVVKNFYVPSRTVRLMLNLPSATNLGKIES